MRTSCERCKSQQKCTACGGTGLRLTVTPSGTGVWASCSRCWGTRIVHDVTRHPEIERSAS